MILELINLKKGRMLVQKANITRRMRTRILSICAIIILLFVLTGCNNEKESSANKIISRNTTNKTVENESKEESALNNVDFKAAAEHQMSMPEDGETIAIMHVKNFGDIKFKFFEDVAPKAVENFLTHAKNGYYDGVTFHRVINEFMIQGGDPTATGSGGESIWGENFQAEVAYEYVPYRGSLCMASSSLGIGSQFFITQANYSESMENAMINGGYPEGLIEQYKNYGGYLSLYLQYTVFGQVFEGMDVVDKIAAVETELSSSNEKSKPVEDVVIESIEVTTYKTN